MNAALLAFFVLVLFAIGYRFYSHYLSFKLFDLDDESKTPAEEFQDDIDYVPTKKSILFGHHYASIAGAAPIVGPAVAVIWGWVPALIWVVLGTIFMGAAHDFGALVLSMRNKGKSIGELTGGIIGPRSRNLFLIVILFLVWLVIAVFALVIANLFIKFPSSVLPVNFEIIVAVLIGLFIHRKGKSILWPSIAAQIGLFVMIWLGTIYPISLSQWVGSSDLSVWIVFLLIYSMIASILPVWTLLQPRDYINSHQLIIGLGLLFFGLFVTQPEIVAPALNLNPEGAPFWFPFLFITIACGAVSGFHGLVSSGTTSKQVRKWKDARPIGYGGMIGEGTLALLATLAVTTGFANTQDWHSHYGSWQAAKGLTPAMEAFVMGCSRFLAGLGIPHGFGSTMIAVLIISFAATSLDTATRIQRYVITELGDGWKIPGLHNRYLSSFLAVTSAGLLMMVEGGGKGGLLLWPLFGATNQMLAALTLVIICVYLIRKKKPVLPYLIPVVFLTFVTMFGLLANIANFYNNDKFMLMMLSVILFVIEVWIVGEAWVSIRKARITKSTPR